MVPVRMSQPAAGHWVSPEDYARRSETPQMPRLLARAKKTSAQHSCCRWDSIHIHSYFHDLGKTSKLLENSLDGLEVGQASSFRPCQSPEQCFLCGQISVLFPFWAGLDKMDCLIGLEGFAQSYWFEHKAFPGGINGLLLPAFGLTMWLGEKIPDSGRVRGPALWFPGYHEAGMFQPQLIPPSFDVTKAKRWMSQCDRFHQNNPCQRPGHGRPKHLIDCQTRMIVSAQGGELYVALSYVWGRAGSSLPSGAASDGISKPLEVLPRTLEDAIAVTKLLGYRFLWIDMICIDQTNAEEKHEQIARMDEVYQSANLTIIVAAGLDYDYGIPGVSARQRLPQTHGFIDGVPVCDQILRPRDEMVESSWWSRGWTFQESLLSRRRLVFTEYQMFFECTASHSCESVGGLEFAESDADCRYYERFVWDHVWDQRIRVYESLGIPGPPDFQSEWTGIEFLTLILTDYSKKRLSFASDVFNAFQAIANAFAKGTNPVYTLCGLPFQGQSERSINETLARSLLWYGSNGIDGSRDQGFPTWSWTSVHSSTGVAFSDDNSALAISVKAMACTNGQTFLCRDMARWWKEAGGDACRESLTPRMLAISAPEIRQQIWSDAIIENEWGLLRIRCVSALPQGKGPSYGVFVVYHRITIPLGLPDASISESEEKKIREKLDIILGNLRRGSWKALCMDSSSILIVGSTGTLEMSRIGLVSFEIEYPDDDGRGMYRGSTSKERLQEFYQDYTQEIDVYLV